MDINTILKSNRKLIFKYLCSLTKDESLSDDLTQITLLKLAKALNSGKYVDQLKFISWILKITHNVYIDYYRNKKYLTCNIDDCRFLPNPKNQLTEDSINLLYNLIDKLPKPQRDVVNYRFDGLTFREISIKVDTSINTVLARYRYATNKLRKSFKNLGINCINDLT